MDNTNAASTKTENWISKRADVLWGIIQKYMSDEDKRRGKVSYQFAGGYRGSGPATLQVLISRGLVEPKPTRVSVRNKSSHGYNEDFRRKVEPVIKKMYQTMFFNPSTNSLDPDMKHSDPTSTLQSLAVDLRKLYGVPDNQPLYSLEVKLDG